MLVEYRLAKCDNRNCCQCRQCCDALRVPVSTALGHRVSEVGLHGKHVVSNYNNFKRTRHIVVRLE